MATRVRRRHRRPHRTRWHKVAIPLVFVIGILVAAGGVAAAWAIKIYNEAPPLASLKEVQKGRSSAIYTAEGKLIGYIQSDTVRQPIGEAEIPQVLRNATVSIEDKDFWQHGALDYAGIVRAAIKDISAGGKPVQGASTITQQLVRNLYIRHPEDTIQRKIKEAHLAEELFEAHSRKWILNTYLNTAPYGTNEGRTELGVEAAAQTYFDKPASELNLTEAALIAGLPQAPSEYNPFIDPKAALQRRNEVLGTMWEQGYITHSRYLKARTSGLGLHAGTQYTTVHDPFLFRLVEQELIERYGINTVRNGGLKAYTTINPELQKYAEEAVAYCTETYTCHEGGPVTGLASVDPKTGAILALASTPGEAGEEEFNYAWQAEKQPGSSFKPYVLATAVKQGIDPKDTYYNGTAPATLEIPGGGTWTVNNSEEGAGVMSLEEATWNSVNVVYAKLDLDVGPENVTQTAEEMGIETELLSVPAEAIGGLSHGVSPLEQADGYATLASGGVHHDPTAISKVEFPDGKVDEIESEEGHRALTPGQAYVVTNVLKGVITHGTGTGYTNLACSEVAGKTGTTDEETNAWFVGYTPEYSTAVWVGHPRANEYTGFGGPTAGPIWKDYMEKATAGKCPAFEVPATLPELSPLTGGHTASSSEYSPQFGEEELEEEEEGEVEGGLEAEEEEGGAEETEEAPAEEATHETTPPPAEEGGLGAH